MQNEVVRQVSRMNLPKKRISFGQIGDTLKITYSCHLFQSEETPYRNESERIQRKLSSTIPNNAVASSSSINLAHNSISQRYNLNELVYSFKGQTDKFRVYHNSVSRFNSISNSNCSYARSYSTAIIPSETKKHSKGKRRSRIEMVNRMINRAEKKYSASAHSYDDKLQYLTRLFLASRRYYASKWDSTSLIEIRIIRRRIAKEAMHLLNSVKREKDLNRSRRFEEGCLYVQALAFLKGGKAAYEAFEELSKKFELVMEEIKSETRMVGGNTKNKSKLSERTNATYMAIESIIEICYHESSEEEILHLAERILSNEIITNLNQNAINKRRARFHPLIWRIRYPFQFIKKFIEDRQNDIKLNKESITSVLAALCNQKRLTDAFRIFHWANRLGMRHKMQLSIRLLRELTKIGDYQLGGEVEAVIKKDLSEIQDDRLAYLAYMVFALRCARRGDKEGLEESLSIYTRSGGGRDALRLAKDEFMHKMHIINHSVRGEIEECVALLSKTFDIDELINGITISSWNSPQTQQRQPPNKYACTMLVRAFLQADLTNEAELLIERLSERKFDIPIGIFNDLLKHYVKRDDFASAMSLFDELNNCEVPLSKETFNAMITLFARKGDIESTAKLIQLAHSKNVKNGRYFYNGLLQAHIEARSWQGAINLFEQMLKSPDHEYHPDHITFTSMLRLYVNRGMPIQETFTFFERILNAGFTPNEHTFTLLLVSAWDAKMFNLAESIFTLAEQYLGDRNGRPIGKGANAFHFSTMINGYLEKNDLDIARQYLEELIKRKEPIEGVLRSIIVKAYTRENGNEESTDEGKSIPHQLADQFTERFPTQFSTIFQPVLMHAAKIGDVEQIENLIREMVKRDLDVPIRTWSVLLKVLRENSDIEGALKVWDAIFNKALERESRLLSSAIKANKESSFESVEIKPSMRHTLCVPLSDIIETLSSAERFDDIAKIWLNCRKHGFAFDSHNWNHLTVALFRAGRVVDACNIIERVLNGDPPSFWSPNFLMAAYEDALKPDIVQKGKDGSTDDQNQMLDSVQDPANDSDKAKKSSADSNTKNLGEFDLPQFEGEGENIFGRTAHEHAQAQTGSKPSRSLYRFPLDDPFIDIPESISNYPKESVDQSSLIESEEDEDNDREGVGKEGQRSHNDMLFDIDSDSYLRPLKARQIIDRIRSPWFAHFQTLFNLRQILDEAHFRDDLIDLPVKSIIPSMAEDPKDVDDDNDGNGKLKTGGTISVQQLFKTHPRVEQLMRVFDRKLEEVREEEKKRSLRRRMPAEVSPNSFFDNSSIGFGDRGNDEEGEKGGEREGGMLEREAFN